MRSISVVFLLAALALPVRAEEGAPVEVAEVVARQVAVGRSFTGTVEPSRRSVVGSEFGGIVTDCLVREGDRVEVNDPLAQLRTEHIELRIEAATADLTRSRERLRELENGSRPEDVKQVRARVAQLEAELELRKWKLEAALELRGSNTISEDELRDARLAVRASELLRDAGQAALELVEAGPREEEIAQARAEIARKDAEVRRLEDEKTRYTIRAPFTGWVVAERTEIGQWLGAGAPVVEMVALDYVDVTVDVVEDFVGGLVEGQSVRVSIDAIPDRVFTGPIHRIVPSADRRGRTFPVKIRLENEARGDSVLLKAGMFATANLAVGEEHPAVFVPKDAIVLGGMAPVMVWTVDGESSTAKMAPVTLGVAVDDLIEVIGPVKPGDRVVVKGNERIRFPGQPLRVLEN